MKKQVAIIGCAGYTGYELTRILLNHSNVEIKYLVGQSNAGKFMSEIFPQFYGVNLPQIFDIGDVDVKLVDIAFFCLPHGLVRDMVKKFDQNRTIIIDLSADFRIKNLELHNNIYKTNFTENENSIYAIPELAMDELLNYKYHRIISCAGCYATSVILPLKPVIDLIEGDINIDAKSGISGAGRAAKMENLFCEINENIKAYNIATHRHIHEIEQAIGRKVNFTPQVVPMNRGIMSNIYFKANKNSVISVLNEQYKNAKFVKIFDGDKFSSTPSIKEIVGTNLCKIYVFSGRLENSVIIISILDNLIKGASGQAVQNMNIVCGFREDEALTNVSVL